MPRPRLVSDDQIARAARETFLQHGPGAAVALVAEKLGVSHAALLHRVGSKEQLLLLALHPGEPLIADRLREPVPSRGAPRRLVELLLDLLAFLRQMLPGLLVLRSGGVPLSRALEGREPPTVQFRRLLGAWLRRAGVAGRRRSALLAEALLGTIEARCFNAQLGGEQFVEGEDERLVSDLVAELVPELRGSRPRAKAVRVEAERASCDTISASDTKGVVHASSSRHRSARKRRARGGTSVR